MPKKRCTVPPEPPDSMPSRPTRGVPMIRSIIAVATALAITGGSAQAYQLLGPGGASCGTWVADQRTAPSMYHLDEAWGCSGSSRAQATSAAD